MKNLHEDVAEMFAALEGCFGGCGDSLTMIYVDSPEEHTAKTRDWRRENPQKSKAIYRRNYLKYRVSTVEPRTYAPRKKAAT